MATITNREIPGALQALTALADQPMPPRAAYRVSKLMRAAGEQQDHVEAARRNLLRQYAKKDAQGEMRQEGDHVILEPATLADFERDYSELMDRPADFLLAVYEGDLQRIEQIAPRTLYMLGGLLQAGDEPADPPCPPPIGEPPQEPEA